MDQITRGLKIALWGMGVALAAFFGGFGAWGVLFGLSVAGLGAAWAVLALLAVALS